MAESSPGPVLRPGEGEAWAAFAATEPARSAFAERLRAAAGSEVAWLSLETQQAFYEEQLRNDDTDYLDRLDPGTTGLELLVERGVDPAAAREAARRAGLEHILERGYRLLSTGESRLLLLLSEVVRAPGVLVLEQPFDGFDARFRAQAERLLADRVAGGSALVAFVDRLDDAPGCTTGVLVLREGAPPSLTTGPELADCRRELSAEIAQLLELGREAVVELPAAPGALASLPETPLPEKLIVLRDGAVRYHLAGAGRVAQFEGLSWELSRGEHLLVTGPNGSGKSTLLSLITGDHPQCYSNDLTVLGHRRGSGESVWDVKRHLGLVSPALHRDYRVRTNLASVVVSGLYDSIGVYRDVPESHRLLALDWLDAVGLSGRAGERFDRLSFGQQRLVLIARGLIKHPPLLILDEPTQGLSELGRQLVLAFVEKLASLRRTTLIMVTHREDERLALFRRHLSFEPSGDARVRFRVVQRELPAGDGAPEV